MSRNTRHRSGGRQATTNKYPGEAPRVTQHEAQHAEMYSSGVTPVRDECRDDRRHEPHPGALLRRARIATGMSLEDLARRTKIPQAVLLALESSDLDRLPATVYTRGFVKSYAHEVGLDPERTTTEFLAAIEPLSSRHLASDAVPGSDESKTVDVNDDTRHQLAANQLRRFSRLALAGAALGLIVYFTSSSRSARPADTITGLGGDAISASNGVAAAADAVVPTLAAADTDAPAITPGEPLQVELVPQGPCWLSANVDGERVVYRLLQAGERQTLAVSEEAVLRVGDPGAVTLSINGQALRSLGPAGAPIDLRITRDNYRNLLSS